MKNDTLIIKDASEEVIRKIEDKKANKLIIAGQNGSGKTTTLKYYTNKNIDNNVIYIDYKNIFYDYSLNTIEYKFYHELILSKKILDFIKNNTKYYHNFDMYSKIIDHELENFYIYLVTRFYGKTDINFDRSFISNITFNIKSIDTNPITLIIDHFDLVGNSSQRFQEFMKSYFCFFDKIIITSNDSDILKPSRKKDLENKDYEIIKIDYNYNVKYVKEILDKYFLEWFPSNFIDIKYAKKIKEIITIIRNDNFCKYLINKTNGNIDMMLSIIRTFYVSDQNINEIINQVSNVQDQLNIKIPRKRLYL